MPDYRTRATRILERVRREEVGHNRRAADTSDALHMPQHSTHAIELAGIVYGLGKLLETCWDAPGRLGTQMVRRRRAAMAFIC